MKHAVSAVMLALLMIGASAFVVDAMNPHTPNPSVGLRALIYACLLVLTLRTLLILRIPANHSVDPRFQLLPKFATPHLDCDLIDLICTRLR